MYVYVKHVLWICCAAILCGSNAPARLSELLLVVSQEARVWVRVRVRVRVRVGTLCHAKIGGKRGALIGYCD